ncbi:MAG: hypothetical protein IKT15_00315 [Firmicutes bacterium]|nr:hypothetical protein [Bacillota bacterium]
MRFETFQEDILKNIRDYLPEEFQDAQIRVKEVRKLDRTYQSLSVCKKGSRVVPMIDLDGLYGEYREDCRWLMERMTRGIAESVVREIRWKESMQDDIYLHYETARDKLFIRVSDEETNREMLKDLPHRVIEGLALTCHLFYISEDRHLYTTVVTKDLLEGYGITEEELFREAMENSPKVFPPRFRSLEESIRELEEPDGVLVLPPHRGPKLYELTNREQINGASVLFYPGMMEEIAHRLEDSYYVLPSSVHEVMILPEGEEQDTEMLKAIVRGANGQCLGDGDRLSDTVFHYDMAAKRFETVDDWQRRTGYYLN